MKCVGALAQDEKMRRNTTQTQKNGRNFQYTKFSVIDLVLIDRRTLSGTQWQISSCRFSFSVARNAITKATEYITFGFSFR